MIRNYLEFGKSNAVPGTPASMAIESDCHYYANFSPKSRPRSVEVRRIEESKTKFSMLLLIHVGHHCFGRDAMFGRYLCGSNSSCTTNLLLVAAGAYFHCLTAFMADCHRMGLPPRSWVLWTFPFAPTTISIRTIPPMYNLFKVSG